MSIAVSEEKPLLAMRAGTADQFTQIDILMGRGTGRVIHHVRSNGFQMRAMTSLVWAISITLLTGCGSGLDSPVVAPAPPNDFVKSIVVERVQEKDKVSPIEDETEITVNTGFGVQFEIFPHDKLPAEFHDRKVLDAMRWPAETVIFPRGKTAEYQTTLKGCCPIFPIIQKFPLSPMLTRSLSIKGQESIMINSFHSSFWSDCGFNEKCELKQPVSVESQARMKLKTSWWFWTYLCAPKDQTGDFVYEIRIYPTAVWKSTVRFELGKPVVVKRGLLSVLPENP